jgi:hypothetical protein
VVYILAIFFVGLGFLFFIKLVKDKNPVIILRMNERYPNVNEYVVAIKYELEKQGKEVIYSGNGHFVIDGMHYRIVERRKITNEESLQLTILKSLKSS